MSDFRTAGEVKKFAYLSGVVIGGCRVLGKRLQMPDKVSCTSVFDGLRGWENIMR